MPAFVESLLLEADPRSETAKPTGQYTPTLRFRLNHRIGSLAPFSFVAVGFELLQLLLLLDKRSQL